MLMEYHHVSDLSKRYRINEEDIFLIALNACGVNSPLPYPRMRFRIRLRSRPEETFYFNVALAPKKSPFYLNGDEILFHGDVVAYVEDLENDDVVVSYFRKDRKVLTLNSNARSHCAGCVFCYNMLETASDPRLLVLNNLDNYVTLLEAELGWPDMASLEKVGLSTGCFQAEQPAINHLSLVREVFVKHNFTGSIHFLSSVITSEAGFDRIREEVAPFHLTLTVECFTNREVILKRSKAKLRVEDMPHVLSRSKKRGFETDFTYIVGLDSYDAVIPGLLLLKEHITTFPRFQVYQVHNTSMQASVAKGATAIEYFLRLRKDIERLFLDTELRPKSWENYRPLWYFSFADEELTGIRI